jgi:hypothetical protein
MDAVPCEELSEGRWWELKESLSLHLLFLQVLSAEIINISRWQIWEWQV